LVEGLSLAGEAELVLELGLLLLELPEPEFALDILSAQAGQALESELARSESLTTLSLEGVEEILGVLGGTCLVRSCLGLRFLKPELARLKGASEGCLACLAREATQGLESANLVLLTLKASLRSEEIEVL